MVERIRTLAQKYHQQIIEIRRHLHAHPELSFEEYKTSQYIKSLLQKWDISYTDGLGGGTGIVASIGKGNRTIALRADIDALPIHEVSDCSYRSQNDGIMHACGHDVHTASLLGAIRVIKDIEAQLPGSIKFIFQPGEERLPGGASLMIKDGVLANPSVHSILGQHVHPSLPVGKIGFCSGYFMASADEIFITVNGDGGHGAMPHLTKDPIVIAAEIITALQSITSRQGDPTTSTVLTIGKINSDGGATNIIPDRVLMEGTFRTFDEEWRQKAHQLITNKIQHIASAHGATADVRIEKGYPALYNDPDLTTEILKSMTEYMGTNNVIELAPRMTSEDFAYYSHQIKACFWRLGTASTDGTNTSQVHTNTFDIDEEALRIGSGLMAWCAWKLLQSFDENIID